MKHSQSEMYPKAKKIHCVLCNGVVAFDKSSPERFSEHLRFDHEVSEGLDWVVAGSLISVETRQRVLDVIEKSTPFPRTSKTPVSDKDKVKEPVKKPVIDVVLSDEEEEAVEKVTPETTEETENAVNTETNNDKELQDSPNKTADEIPEDVVSESKKVDISCKLCPYKATTNFGLGKHIKKIHPSSQKKNAGDEMIKLVQTETDKLIESAKKKTGHYKERSSEAEINMRTETEKETKNVAEKDQETSKETEKSTESMTKATNVYGDIHKMLVEETKTNRRKSLRKRKSETEKLLEEKTESAEKPNSKDSNQKVALEEIESREITPMVPRDETQETTPVKEEATEPPVKKKRRRTELKSDVQKSVAGSLEEESNQKVLSPSELQKLTDEVSDFSNFLTTTLNEERSISENPNSEDAQNTAKPPAENSHKKKKSKKRKRSLDVEEEPEEKEPEVEAEDLSAILLVREPEVDLSSSEYFMSKKTMITKLSNQRLEDPSFIEKIQRDENLPPNWFNYVQFYNQGTRRVREFLTPDRRLIRSIDGVGEFLLASETYTEEEIDEMMSKLSSKARRSIVKTEIL